MTDYSKQPPPVTDFGEVRLDFPQKRVLPNGMTLYTIGGGDQEVNRLEVVFGGGAYEEDMVLQATMTSSMIAHGSDTRSSQEVAERLDFCGSWLGSRCLDSHTAVTLHSLNRCFPETLRILADIVYNPAFPEKELELLRNRTLSSYRTAREKVKFLASNELSRLYFGDGHPLAKDVKDSDIERIQADDLRWFHGRYYHPSNCTVILSGCIGEAETRLVTDILGSMPDSRPADPLAACPGRRSDVRFGLVDKPGAVQAAVAMALPAPPRSHPDYIPLRVLVMALGGYFGSRLMSNIREDKGYTYGISAMLLGRMAEANISINTQCDNQYVKPLIDEVKSEMLRLQDEPMPQEELKMVKSYIMSDLVKTLDSPFSVASYVSSVVFFGVAPDYFNRQVECLRHITPEVILQMARRYLNTDDMTTVVAGDKAKINKG